MSRESYAVAIDIGSHSAKTIITQINEGEKPRIIGVGISPSEGMRRSSIIDLEEAGVSIKKSIELAEKMAGVEVDKALISIGGSHLQYIQTQGVIAIGRADGEVTEDDVQRVIEASQAVNIPHNYQLLHVIPQSFSLDSQRDIKDPVGMNGIRLEMKGILVVGFVPHIKNISKCLFGIGVETAGFVVSPLASSEAVLNKRQKELGVVMIDIGGGTTSIAVYEESELIHLAVIPVGAGHITNDVAIGLRTSIEVAEKVKIELGSALPFEIGEKEQVNLSEIEKEEEGTVSRRHICEIIEARVEEIFFLVEKELKKINKSALLPAGAVLVGGGAKLQGVVDLAKNTLKLPAQVGFPMELSGLIDKVDDPAFSVSVGMLIWSLNEDNSEIDFSYTKRNSKGFTGNSKNVFSKIPGGEVVGEIKDWLGKFLP